MEGVSVIDLEGEQKKKVVFCIPTLAMPHKACLQSLEDSVPFLDEAGWDHGVVFEVGCPYISAARMNMLRKALDAKPTVVVFIDSDVAWAPKDLLTLIETEGDVVAGTYRFKKDKEEYMGMLEEGEDKKPIVRKDGCVKADLIPAGFLKMTVKAVDKFMKGHPELCFGPAYSPTVDLFRHGVEDGTWYSEDYAFSKHWRETGNDIWIVPNLNLDHWSRDKDVVFKGNFHEFLLRQPGGSEWKEP